MDARILSVKEERFKEKTGERATKGKGARDAASTMYRVYLSDDRGEVGSLYTNQPCKAGDVVEIGIKVRDGKLLPKLIFR